MNKELILEAIKKVRESSSERNFKQTIDLIINLKGLDLKKPEQNVDAFIVLPHGKGKKVKICALVDDELAAQAKTIFDYVINRKEFAKYQADKVALKKIARDCNFFIAQAALMPEIAKFFGRVLGPKGKMPNPKAGCVIPTGMDLKKLNERLQNLIRVQTKNETIIKCPVGIEGMKDEEIEANSSTVYNAVVHVLPEGESNVNSVILKTTMGKPVKVGQDAGKKSN